MYNLGEHRRSLLYSLMHFHLTHQDLVYILFRRGGGGSQCPFLTRLRVLKLIPRQEHHMHVIHGTWIPDDDHEFTQTGSFYLWVETDMLQGPQQSVRSS